MRHPKLVEMIEEARPHMKYHGTGVWTDDQLLASYALARLKGGYHHLGKIKDCGSSGVQTSIHGTISTFDFTDMTDAVLIAHQMGVRLEVGSSGPRMLKVYAHVRTTSDDAKAGIAQRHPSVLGLIERARKFVWEGGGL